MFSTQIALMHRGRLVVGVSSAPAYGELAYGEIGVGAWLNDQPIRVSEIDAIEAAALSTGNLKTLATGPQWPAFGRLVGRLNRIRGYGDFLHYHLLASGKIDAVVESDVNILDVGACAVIVEAAGGRFTDLDGQPLGAREHFGARQQRPAARTGALGHPRLRGAAHGHEEDHHGLRRDRRAGRRPRAFDPRGPRRTVRGARRHARRELGRGARARGRRRRGRRRGSRRCRGGRRAPSTAPTAPTA